jgi:hypothetical protein
MESLLEIATNLSTLAAGVGVIWAVVEFVKKIRDEREERRSAAVETWREVAAYDLFRSIMTQSPPDLDARELLSRLRDLSWEEEGIDIRKDELTEKSVLRMLMSMIDRGLIEHTINQRFSVKVNSRDLVARGYYFNNIYEDVIEVVRDFSGQLTEADLRQRMGQIGFSHHFRRIIKELIDYGFLLLDNDGRIHCRYDSDWATAQNAVSVKSE